jgi:molybdopterin-binding protein
MCGPPAFRTRPEVADELGLAESSEVTAIIKASDFILAIGD